ncbi:DUF58 domain-containing protein [bacterium]|nr:DUF58 domain-containing protein [bacterium]
MISPTIHRAIRRIEIRSRRIVNTSLAGEYHSVFKGQGINFAEVREYSHGDDVRQIDWNVTARAGKPHVKVFNESRELTVMILADLSGSGRFGSQVQTKRELTAELVAVLGLCAARNNDRVGTMLFTDRVEHFIPPGKGRHHVLRMIRDSLAFEPKHTRTSLGTALQELFNIQKRSAIVFVVSDFLDEGFWPRFRLAAKRFDVVPIVVRDPHEYRLPKAGILALNDAETGAVHYVDSSLADVRKRFESHAIDRDNQLKSRMNEAGVTPIWVEVGQSYVEPLARYFRGRTGRK